jgi:hypothetical protein
VRPILSYFCASHHEVRPNISQTDQADPNK